MSQTKFLTPKNQTQEQLAYNAMAMYPDDAECLAFLKEQNIETTANYLAWLRRNDPMRYEEAREQLKQYQEKKLTNDLLDNAGRAAVATGLAIETTQKMLEKGQIIDTAKVARELADVMAKSTDKKLALEGRPGKITQERGTEEILRKLEEMRVITRVDAESTAEDMQDGT